MLKDAYNKDAELKKKYGDKIKVVFKNYPLPFHKDAKFAAQASLCAHEQNKFWEYHDLLFDNQQSLSAEHLRSYAEQTGVAHAMTAMVDNHFNW